MSNRNIVSLEDVEIIEDLLDYYVLKDCDFKIKNYYPKIFKTLYVIKDTRKYEEFGAEIAISMSSLRREIGKINSLSRSAVNFNSSNPSIIGGCKCRFFRYNGTTDKMICPCNLVLQSAKEQEIMKFKERKTEYQGRKKLIKVDAANNPILGEEEILVNVVKDEGIIFEEGTPLNVETLSNANWRDDDYISFKQRDNDSLPNATFGETKIVTLNNGKSYLIPPASKGDATELGAGEGTNITVNGAKTGEINFKDDPQKQIDNLQARIDEVLNSVYPVGSIYMSVVNLSPASFIGGAWTVWGTGRVAVGVDTNDPEFNYVEKEGGDKSPQQHTHTINSTSLTGDVMRDSGYGLIAPNGSVSGILSRGTHRNGGIGSGGSGGADDIRIDATHGHTAGNYGSGTSGNLQPYITCYMWKRIG